MAEAWILDARRTPRGRGKRGRGALTELHPQDLLAQTLHAVVERSGVNPGDVDDVIAGCVAQVGDQGANIARNAVLAAGWPDTVPATSINRFCGSGLQAVTFAAMGVMSGIQQLAVGCGVESMSHNGLGADGGGTDGGNLHLRERVVQVPQGISADLIATREGIPRTALDEFALKSQRNAATARAEGRFSRSLFEVRDPVTGATLLARDEYPRPETTAEGLAALAPAFEALGAVAGGLHGETFDQLAVARYPDVAAIRHVHTAGNASGIVDGAGAVLMASPEYARSHGLVPRARVRAMAALGSEPLIMLTAPADVSRRALAQAGMQVADVDLWEINEAFAVVPLQTIRALGIHPERVNVNGGAIALGHPLGATGAILLGTALDELERADRTVALITLCIGGGQGVAVIIERI